MAWLQKGLDDVALFYVILVFPIPFFWLIIHSGIHFWRRFGNRSYWVALPVWTAFGTMGLLARDKILSGRFHSTGWAVVVGLSLLAFGFWLGWRVDHDLGFRRLAGLPEMNPAQYPGGVVGGGVYRYVRHPRYLAYILTLSSFAFLTRAKGMFIVAALSVLLYQVVTSLEERELREHYGSEYEAYARKVPRFVPRPWRRR